MVSLKNVLMKHIAKKHQIVHKKVIVIQYDNGEPWLF